MFDALKARSPARTRAAAPGAPASDIAPPPTTDIASPPVPESVPAPVSAPAPAPVPDPATDRPSGGAQGGVRLVAVVVTHNRLGQLRRTVRRLLSEGVDHLVVVDNASRDGTADWLAEVDDARLHVHTSRRNQGGAGGFEQGLRRARALFDADWYLVMDDDARPHPGAIARFRGMVEGAADPADWEAFAGGVYYPDGTICETNRPARNPFWCWRSFLRTLMGGGRAGFHVANSDYDTLHPMPVDTASFVGLFLSRAALDRADYPRGELFIYGDDVLYTLELSRAGGRIGFAPWLAFEHDCTTFRRGEGQVHRPLWKVYYNYRNGLFAYRAAAGAVLFWPVVLISVPKWALKLRKYDRDERPVFLRLLALAVRDGIAGQRHRPHRQIRAMARPRRSRAAP